MRSSTFRPVLYVVGVLLAVGTLVGARFLSAGSGGGTDPLEAAKARYHEAAAPARAGSGPVVLGYVDSNPSMVQYGLPPNMQTGLVAQVFVKEGDVVEANAPLFAFDTSLQEADLQRAEAAVAAAVAKLNSARAAAEEHRKKEGLQQQVVEVAKLKFDLAKNAYNVAYANLLDSYRTQGFAEATWPERLAKDPKLVELANVRQTSEKEWALEIAKLEVLKAAPVDLLAKEAEAAVNQAKAEVEKAKAALKLCTVRSHVPGIVERVAVSPGDVMGLGARSTAVWFVPAGPRIVRAEVEPEFAYRVTMDAETGKKREVTIFDFTDSKRTYKGVLTRVGTSFLPKRSGSEGLLGGDSRVLECVIEVADWAPKGGPPLRVGQKVRVNFGQ